MKQNLEFEYVETKKLVPYVRNAKTHSETQIKKIMGSITEFGFIAPIIIDKNNNVLAGHGRLLAADRLGLEKVPCVREDHLTETQRKAYILADNRIGELASWDNELLKVELEELKIDDFDLEMIGFDDNFVDDLLKEDTETIGDGEQEEEKNEVAENYINEAVRKACRELVEQYKKLEGFSFFTPHISKIEFIKFLFYGKPYRRSNSITFHPMQVRTEGSHGSVIDGLQLIADGKAKVDGIRWQTDERFQKILNTGEEWGIARLPLDFPADLARDLINEFGENGKILDPCAGWGGRLVGFLASTAVEYQGVDASPYQVAGDQAIFECYKDIVPTKKVSIVCSPFEKFELPKDYYNMALTSPPYFDVEIYEGGEQSSNYGNYEKWKECFYYVLISKVYNALKTGGVFCLQVGSQKYPLLQDGIAIAEKCGFIHIESRLFKKGKNSRKEETPIEKMEQILILKKL